MEKVITLPEMTIPLVPGNGKLNGGFADSAFADNKQKPVHRWVPWIAGFSADFVRDVMKSYLIENKSEKLVLDPFCGVGTTLVEAMLYGTDSIGFEINPYAALASTTKCESVHMPASELEEYITEFKNFMEYGDSDPAFLPPEHFRSRIPFFGACAEQKILKALSFIYNLESRGIHNLFATAFGSVMVSLSNYSYEPSLSTRPAAGKPLQEDAPVAESIVSKLNCMQADIEWFKKGLSGFPKYPSGRIINDNFLNALHHLDPNTVDLIITSPPYLNNYHYVRNTRPQMFWLGFIKNTTELKFLEIQNFGKYWQTVRDSDEVKLEFEHLKLTALLNQLRGINNDRGSYGGHGWANYAASYFNDTNRFCIVVSQILKSGGRAVIVVGNSILQGVEIPVDDLLADIAGQHGLMIENIHILRQKRVGASIVSSSIRQGEKSIAKLYESAVIIRK